MKEFTKKWLMLFGLTYISATIIPAIVNNNWAAATFTWQLLLTLLVVCLCQLLTKKLSLKIPLIKYLIDLVVTLLVALGFGWLWKWYGPSYVWMMFAMVIPVYVVGYLLGIIKVRKNVEIINQQIKRRREMLQKIGEEKGNDC